MFAFLNRGKRLSGNAKRAAYDELVKQETEYQLRINELNRKIEKQKQRQQEILDKGKREGSEMARRGLAEQYARAERQMGRLFDRRKMLLQAQELVEDQLANLELQDAVPEEILDLYRPEAQRERARTDMVRARLNQAYDDMLATFENATGDSQMEAHEMAAVQTAMDLFDRERDEEIRLTLQAIEQDLGTMTPEEVFVHSAQRVREIE